MAAKYEKEIRNVFFEVFKKDLIMADVDYDKAITMMFAESGISYNSISDELEKGIAEGYSLCDQLEMLKDGLTK